MTQEPTNRLEAFYQDGWLPCQLLVRKRGVSSAVLVRLTAGAKLQDVWVTSEQVRADRRPSIDSGLSMSASASI